MDDAIDDLMGRWHELADQSVPELEKRFSESSRNLVNEVVNRALGMTQLNDFANPAAFATYVLELRSNERAWSRRLGDLILEAQEHLEKGDKSGALRVFERFESECPWRVFVDIAKIQRENALG